MVTIAEAQAQIQTNQAVIAQREQAEQEAEARASQLRTKQLSLSRQLQIKKAGQLRAYTRAGGLAGERARTAKERARQMQEVAASRGLTSQYKSEVAAAQAEITSVQEAQRQEQLRQEKIQQAAYDLQYKYEGQIQPWMRTTFSSDEYEQLKQIASDIQHANYSQTTSLIRGTLGLPPVSTAPLSEKLTYAYQTGQISEGAYEQAYLTATGTKPLMVSYEKKPQQISYLHAYESMVPTTEEEVKQVPFFKSHLTTQGKQLVSSLGSLYGKAEQWTKTNLAEPTTFIITSSVEKGVTKPLSPIFEKGKEIGTIFKQGELTPQGEKFAPLFKQMGKGAITFAYEHPLTTGVFIGASYIPGSSYAWGTYGGIKLATGGKEFTKTSSLLQSEYGLSPREAWVTSRAPYALMAGGAIAQAGRVIFSPTRFAQLKISEPYPVTKLIKPAGINVLSPREMTVLKSTSGELFKVSSEMFGLGERTTGGLATIRYSLAQKWLNQMGIPKKFSYEGIARLQPKSYAKSLKILQQRKMSLSKAKEYMRYRKPQEIIDVSRGKADIWASRTGKQFLNIEGYISSKPLRYGIEEELWGRPLTFYTKGGKGKLTEVKMGGELTGQLKTSLTTEKGQVGEQSIYKFLTKESQLGKKIKLSRIDIGQQYPLKVRQTFKNIPIKEKIFKQITAVRKKGEIFIPEQEPVIIKLQKREAQFEEEFSGMFGEKGTTIEQFYQQDISKQFKVSDLFRKHKGKIVMEYPFKITRYEVNYPKRGIFKTEADVTTITPRVEKIKEINLKEGYVSVTTPTMKVTKQLAVRQEDLGFIPKKILKELKGEPGKAESFKYLLEQPPQKVIKNIVVARSAATKALLGTTKAQTSKNALARITAQRFKTTQELNKQFEQAQINLGGVTARVSSSAYSIRNIPTTKASQPTISLPKEEAILRTPIKLKPRMELKPKTELRENLILKPIMKEELKLKTELRLNLMLKTNLKLKPTPPITSRPIPPIKFPTIKPPRRPPIFPGISVGRKIAKGYIPFIKRFGKYKPLTRTPLTKGAATSLGARAALGGLGRTFKLERAGFVRSNRRVYMPSEQLRKFRSYKISKGKKIPLGDMFIQRKGTTLSSIGERTEIKAARLRSLF